LDCELHVKVGDYLVYIDTGYVYRSPVNHVFRTTYIVRSATDSEILMYRLGVQRVRS
jgi:hypothetical protein